MIKNAVITIILASIGCYPLVAALADDNGLTLERIQEAIAEKGLHWTAGRTSVSDLSIEQKRRLCGAIVPSDSKQALKVSNDLPAPNLSQFGHQERFDWREQGGVTPVKYQGGCAACWAFGPVAALESMVKIYDGMELDLSEQQIISCNEAGLGCQCGWPPAAYEILRAPGAIRETCMPYSATDTVTCIQNSCEVMARTCEWYDISHDVTSIKNALQIGPLTSYFQIYEDFYYYSGGCYQHVLGEFVAGHCMLIIGWDDTLCSGEGGWIAKNSWSTGWGEEGFFYVEYGECRIGEQAIQPQYKRNTRSGFCYDGSYPMGDHNKSICAPDLDGDGDQDLIVANGVDKSLSVFWNSGGGTFENVDVIFLSNSPSDISCKDFDADGDSDIVVSTYPPCTYIIKNTGNGTFQEPIGYPGGSQGLTAADFDDDGDWDLAVGDGYSPYWCGVRMKVNAGDGSFSGSDYYTTTGRPDCICAHDFDGDSAWDLAVLDGQHGIVSILINNGDGSFQDTVNYPVGIYPQSMCSADFDGDGDHDLAVSGVFILTNNGDGTFENADTCWIPGQNIALCSADFDHDGDYDLAATSGDSASVFILRNNGDGTFQNPVSCWAEGKAGKICSSDLDGDGDEDLAVACHVREVGNIVSVLSNLYTEYSDVLDDDEQARFPLDCMLSQNYPNPFNPITKIEFLVAKPGLVNLNIYNILGRKVRSLVSEHMSSGYKSVLWDGKNDSGNEVTSGIYFYQLILGDFSEAKKMLLLK